MSLRTFENCVLKYVNLIMLTHFLTASGLPWQASFKKTKIELDLLTDI